MLTGAMVPYKFGSSDGLFNLGSALSFVQVLPPEFDKNGSAPLAPRRIGITYVWPDLRPCRECRCQQADTSEDHDPLPSAHKQPLRFRRHRHPFMITTT